MTFCERLYGVQACPYAGRKTGGVFNHCRSAVGVSLWRLPYGSGAVCIGDPLYSFSLALKIGGRLGGAGAKRCRVTTRLCADPNSSVDDVHGLLARNKFGAG